MKQLASKIFTKTALNWAGVLFPIITIGFYIGVGFTNAKSKILEFQSVIQKQDLILNTQAKIIQKVNDIDSSQRSMDVWKTDINDKLDNISNKQESSNKVIKTLLINSTMTRKEIIEQFDLLNKSVNEAEMIKKNNEFLMTRYCLD